MVGARLREALEEQGLEQDRLDVPRFRMAIETRIRRVQRRATVKHNLVRGIRRFESDPTALSITIPDGGIPAELLEADADRQALEVAFFVDNVVSGPDALDPDNAGIAARIHEADPRDFEARGLRRGKHHLLVVRRGVQVGPSLADERDVPLHGQGARNLVMPADQAHGRSALAISASVDGCLDGGKAFGRTVALSAPPLRIDVFRGSGPKNDGPAAHENLIETSIERTIYRQCLA